MLSAVKSLMVIWYYVEDVFNYVVVLYKYKILCNVLNTRKKNFGNFLFLLILTRSKTIQISQRFNTRRGGGGIEKSLKLCSDLFI